MTTQKKIIIGAVVILVVGLAYYAISPLFRNKEIHDALPQESGLLPPAPGDVQDIPAGELFIDGEPTDTRPPETVQELPAAEKNTKAPVMGTVGHPAEGTARIIETESGTVVRYENFSTINGPNLHIYLSNDLDANDYVDLGPIRGTSGDINYEIPAGVDVSAYRYVMHWCVPFSVLFNYAEIN